MENIFKMQFITFFKEILSLLVFPTYPNCGFMQNVVIRSSKTKAAIYKAGLDFNYTSQSFLKSSKSIKHTAIYSQIVANHQTHTQILQLFYNRLFLQGIKNDSPVIII